MLIDKQNLASSPYRDRFLQEIDEHHDDAGNDRLGSSEKLITTFNMYVLDARKQRLVFAAKVALGVFLFMYFGNVIASMLPPAVATPIYTVTGLVGLPITLAYYLPLIHLGLMPVDEITTPATIVLTILGLIAALLTSLFWAGLATLLRYPPKNLVARFK